jgi:hypothetical protein
MGLPREKKLAIFTLLCKKKCIKRTVSGYGSGCKRRATLSHISLAAKLRVCSDVDFKNYLQMTDECFKGLPHLWKLFMEKQNTRMRTAISAEERVTANLRFLATGRSCEYLKFTACISPQALA